MDEPKKINIEQELEACKKQAEEYLNGWKRAKADYINLERQVEKEKSQWMNIAVLPVVLELITLAEHLDQAFAHVPGHQSASGGQVGGQASGEYSEEIKTWIQGIAHTRDDLKDLLKTLQVEKIITEGKLTDLSLMEVVAKEKNESRAAGTVVHEVGAGYTMAGQVIKSAKVVVSE